MARELEGEGDPPLGFVADGVADGRPGRTTISNTNICDINWEKSKKKLKEQLKIWTNSLNKWKQEKEAEGQKKYENCLDWTDSTWNLLQWGLGIKQWGACLVLTPPDPPFSAYYRNPPNPFGIFPPSEPSPPGTIPTGVLSRECERFCFDNGKRRSEGYYELEMGGKWDSDNVPCRVKFNGFDGCMVFKQMYTDWLDNFYKVMLRILREYEEKEIKRIDKERDECIKNNTPQVTP